MKAFLISLLVVSQIGCATTELSPEAKTVRIMKADPASNCEQLGPVDGEGLGFQHWKPDVQHARLRNRAAEMGGNYVRLDETGRIMVGTVFKCP